MPLSETWKNKIQSLMAKSEKIQLLWGATALQQHRKASALESKRVQALDEIGIRAQGGTMPKGDEKMGDIFMVDGDMAAPQSPFAKLAGTALLAAVLGTPPTILMWEYLHREPAPATAVTDTDTRTELRIFRDE